MMPRFQRVIQRLRSTVVSCGVDRFSTEKCIRAKTTLGGPVIVERNSSSGASCGNIPRRSTSQANAFRCSIEEGVDNRAAWKPFSVSAGSGVDPTPETRIADQTHELSELDVDARCTHPGLQIEEEILAQNMVTTLEQPSVPLEELVWRAKQEKEVRGGQDEVNAESFTFVELEVEESHWTNTKIKLFPFESEQEEAPFGCNIDGRNSSHLDQISQDVGLERDPGEHVGPDDYRGRKYLHVLSLHEVKEILEKARAKDLKVLDVKDSCEWTDHILVASGRSSRHLRGMADAIVYKVKQRSRNVGPNLYPLVEGREAEQWMTVDLGKITVHLFLEEARSYYNLEDLWREKRSPLV